MARYCLSCPKCYTSKGRHKQFCANDNVGALNKLRKHLWKKHAEWMKKRIKLGRKNKSKPHNPLVTKVRYPAGTKLGQVLGRQLAVALKGEPLTSLNIKEKTIQSLRFVNAAFNILDAIGEAAENGELDDELPYQESLPP